MTQPTQTADDLLDLFDEPSEEEAGSNGDNHALSLDEINSISGRSFTSKEDAMKFLKNLNSLAGDQKRIELEKKAKEAEKTLTEKEQLSSRIAELERKEKVSDFLLANQGASKEDFELAEAFAEKKGLTLEEAWKTIAGKFASIAKNDEDDEVGVKSKQRITPVQSQQIAQLRESALKGSSDAQEELVKSLIFGSK